MPPRARLVLVPPKVPGGGAGPMGGCTTALRKTSCLYQVPVVLVSQDSGILVVETDPEDAALLARKAADR